MKIPFSKVTRDSSYQIDLENINAVFILKPKNKTGDLVFCELNFHGKLQMSCSICNSDNLLEIDEKVELLINNGIFNGFDENFDVYEMLEGYIDLNNILISELELIKSDYYKCDNCYDKNDI